MLEISGIPTSKDGDTKVIVCKLANLAMMQDFSKDKIDVGHRTSSNLIAPAVVLFYKKNDTNIFFNQEHKVKNT